MRTYSPGLTLPLCAPVRFRHDYLFPNLRKYFMDGPKVISEYKREKKDQK